MVRGMCVLGQVTWVTCIYMITFKLIPVTHQPLVPSDCRRGRSTFLLAYKFGWTRFDTHRGTPQPEGAGSWSSACKGLPKTTCRTVPFCTLSGTGLAPGERWASVEYRVLYVPSVASLLCVWLARLVRWSSETFLPYFPGSPEVC